MEGRPMFAHWLDQQMNAHGYTNVLVGAILEVSQGAVWAWRKGKNTPSLQHIETLADLFGVSEFEIYWRIKGRDPETVKDAYLFTRLGLEADTPPALLDLCREMIPVMRRWLERQAELGEAEEESSSLRQKVHSLQKEAHDARFRAGRGAPRVRSQDNAGEPAV